MSSADRGGPPGAPHARRPGEVTAFQRVSSRYDAAVVRAWALSRGIEVARSGGLPRYLYDLYEAEAVGATVGPA